MKKYQKNILSKKGFGLIEIVVGVSLLGAVLVAIGSVAQRSLVVARLSLQETQANFLLEEGTEVMRIFRDTSWVNISGLSTTTTYYLTYSSGDWATTTTLTKVDGLFTRTVNVSDVARDANDDIVKTGGTVDTGTKKITVRLDWPTGYGTTTKAVEFYLTDI
jgi:type II secretory pathway pseudopilin PulG